VQTPELLMRIRRIKNAPLTRQHIASSAQPGAKLKLLKSTATPAFERAEEHELERVLLYERYAGERELSTRMPAAC
jgi:hypothetical protein